MIGYKNVRLLFIMRNFINPFRKNKNQREPKISPNHTKPEDHISPANPSKKRSRDDKRKQQQHDRHKENKSIDTIDPLQRFENIMHPFLFLM